LTPWCVWQRHNRNAGLAGNASSSLRFHEFLLDAPFEEFGFQTIRPDFAVSQHGVALNPEKSSSKG
jgi:hypothetical protein